MSANPEISHLVVEAGPDQGRRFTIPAAGARLELLAKLVEDYETLRFPIERPDAVHAIQFRMQQQGLKQKDLAELLGGKSRASEILSRKRRLTVPMIRTLSRRLHIPVDLLVR